MPPPTIGMRLVAITPTVLPPWVVIRLLTTCSETTSFSSGSAIGAVATNSGGPGSVPLAVSLEISSPPIMHIMRAVRTRVSSMS